MIRKRLALNRIADITVARAASAGQDEVLDLISTIKIDAGLPLNSYLEAPIDKEGLMALSQQLGASTDKKV